MNEIRNLSELYRIFEKGNNKRISYFRGQASDWPLLPSIARPTVTDEERLREKEYYRRLAAFLPSSNDWEIATIAQHYKIPTRLIDWSENPLVAAYFAVSDREFDHDDGVIWFFEDRTGVAGNRASIHDSDEVWGNRHYPDGKERRVRGLNYPRPYRAWKDLQYKIPRTIAQRGSLTSQPDLYKTFDLQVTDDKTQSCEKFIVPKSAKHHLRRQLEVSGITTERLFPDYLETGTGNPMDLIGDCMRIRCEIFSAS